MNIAELQPRGKVREKSLISPQEQVDRMVAETVLFVVKNLPDRRFLPGLAETENPLAFKIGQQEWMLTVRNDRGPDNEPVRGITMTTISPITNEKYAKGIITDHDFRYITGIYLKIGNYQNAIGIPPMNLENEVATVRRQERETVRWSFMSTGSISRTSELQSLRYDRVESDIAYYRRHGLFRSKKRRKIKTPSVSTPLPKA